MCIVFGHQFLRSYDILGETDWFIGVRCVQRNDHPVYGFHCHNGPNKRIITLTQKYKQKHKTGAYLIYYQYPSCQIQELIHFVRQW